MSWRGERAKLDLGVGNFSKGQGRKGKTEKLNGWNFERDCLSSNPVFFQCLHFFKFNEDNQPHRTVLMRLYVW